ncbi:hypothetical protein pmac_cds_849 [Pandoravirus macleodensis]|uniref:F-box incomplete domain containing protein n=1 Tax=Pandoravirus macleodensis TaxID=2107707 RepID=A0A2U7UGC1_9VIRU|nr:hypothetical protein pmac_cds_849 [Pandoravirus macleodensis]AVK77537.1 hypothetical protein pmac_cds_849 [Pandoravirus macleodensis]
MTSTVPVLDETWDRARTLPAELVCAILEHVESPWLAVAARVSSTWYDCALAVGGEHATMITEALVDQSLIDGADDVVRWCVQDMGCPWTPRRALLAALVDSPLVCQMGGVDRQTPATALVALSADTPCCHQYCPNGHSCRSAARVQKLERVGYQWDEGTLACAAVSLPPSEFEILADAHPAGVGLAWVVAAALGRTDLLDLLHQRWGRAAPRDACVHVANKTAQEWVASRWGQYYASGGSGSTGISVCGWRSWADPPEHALAVWIAQHRETFVADPHGLLASAVLGVEYDATLSQAQTSAGRARTFARMALYGRPLYERGPYLSESARIARHTMLQVDAILKSTRTRRGVLVPSGRSQLYACQAR